MRPSTGRPRSGGIQFSGIEVRDLLAAWGALGVAFAIFFGGGAPILQRPIRFVELLVISIVTAGVGFLLHELAHKVVAIRYGQIAEFRANYPMLALAIAAALGGFIFAAPGAVYHRGRITVEQNGVIALAGPVTNVLLGLLFLPIAVLPVAFLATIGQYGVLINFFLAGFNLLPFGPLDGRKVWEWNVGVFVVSFVGSVGLLVASVILFLF